MQLVNFNASTLHHKSERKYEKHLTNKDSIESLGLRYKNINFYISGKLKELDFLLELTFENKVLKRSDFVVYDEITESYKSDENMIYYFWGVTDMPGSLIQHYLTPILNEETVKHGNENFINFLYNLKKIYLEKLLSIVNNFGSVEELKQDIQAQVA